LSFVSTMFPHLSHRARQPFRIGFAFLVVALLALAAGHLEGPVIAVSALGVPLLFALYLYEVDVYEDEPVRTLALTVGLGAALGVGWTLLTDHLVTTAVRTNLLGGPMPSSGTWHSIAAVFVPVGGQLLMVVPVLVMRIRTRLRPDSLDGFVHGAAGALGFAVAATLVELTPQLGNGVIVGTGGVGSIIAEAIIHGLTVPVLAASATGLIGAALWVNRRAINGRSGRWLTSFATAAVLALIVQAGLGFTDVDAPGTGVVLTAHIAAAAAFLVALRIGLHHVLLHEAHDVVIGPPRICHHCHHVVPSAPFCAHCGAAQVATTPSARTGLVAAAAGASAGEGGGAS
jgi:RsiW-degrading membrane proteinase PrsW (M82 family)